MSTFKYGNFEVEFDPTDVAFLEKYEAAAGSYKAKVKSVPSESKPSVTLKAICKVFF